MLMPSDYQHKHQNGLDSSTESAIKYLRYVDVFADRANHNKWLVYRKHQYTPEFQKHARLYEVSVCIQI